MTERELRAAVYTLLDAIELGTECLCPCCQGMAPHSFDEHEPGCELAQLLYVELKDEVFRNVD